MPCKLVWKIQTILQNTNDIKEVRTFIKIVSLNMTLHTKTCCRVLDGQENGSRILFLKVEYCNDDDDMIPRFVVKDANIPELASQTK